MGYMTDGLTFNTLRNGNTTRLGHFKNAQGGLAHSTKDGSDWNRAEWMEAVVGELGEYCNDSKKHRRGDFDEAEFKRRASKELSDVVIYIDLLAYRLGIDLGKAVMETWNQKSRDLGIPIELRADDWHYTRTLPPQGTK